MKFAYKNNLFVMLLLVMALFIVLPVVLLVLLLLIIAALIYWVPFEILSKLFMNLMKSVLNILLTPVSLLKIIFNKRIRQNHALEHATIKVLEEWRGKMNVSGLATPEGFILRNSFINSSDLWTAANEGLRRLKKGERDLAIHPQCGSSLTISTFLFSSIFI